MTWSWEEFWVWYSNTTKEIQEDILRQLNLKEFLESLTSKYRVEILEHAPASMRREFDMVSDFLVTDKMKQLLDRNGMVMK